MRVTVTQMHVCAAICRYYVLLPANKLELWFALESERFQAPVFRYVSCWDLGLCSDATRAFALVDCSIYLMANGVLLKLKLQGVSSSTR